MVEDLALPEVFGYSLNFDRLSHLCKSIPPRSILGGILVKSVVLDTFLESGFQNHDLRFLREFLLAEVHLTAVLATAVLFPLKEVFY